MIGEEFLSKVFLSKVFLIASICVTSIAHSASDDVGNSIRDDYLQLIADVERDLQSESPSSRMVEAFDKHASKLLLKWQQEAPEDIRREVAILNEHKGVERVESRLEVIERLKDRGVEGRGAALKLVELVGSGAAVLPPELLFWRSATEEGVEAVDALASMNEAGAIAILYAYTHDFDGITLEHAFSTQSSTDKRIKSYINRLVTANQGLQSIFSIPTNKKNMKPRELWVALLLKSKPEDFARTNTQLEESVNTNNRVDIESSVPWYENGFLVALVIGAVIVFVIGASKKA